VVAVKLAKKLSGSHIRLAAAVLAVGAVSVGSAGAQTPKWDRIANIKEMAVHIGTVQRTQGADRAMQFIDACYRTHGLGSVYSKSFEGCIVADYLLAQALVAVVSRIPADELRKSGAAAPEEIIRAVQLRIGSAFGQYGVTTTDAAAFVALAEQHGMFPFMRAVFPNADASAPAKNP
jgi:hypothetical protein